MPVDYYDYKRLKKLLESIHESIQNISRDQIKKQDEVLKVLHAIHEELKVLNKNK